MSAKAWSRSPERAVAAAVLAAMLLPQRAAAADASPPPVAVPADASPTEPAVVAITLNGNPVADGQLVFLGTAPGDTRVWLPVDVARGWRMDVSGRSRRDFQRKAHVAFCADRERCVYDDASALLTIALPLQEILPLRIAPVQPEALAPADQPTGGFLNYDLSAWRHGRPGVSAFAEGHAYSAWGHGAARVAGVYTDGRGTRSLAQAVWQIDQPEANRSIQIGSIAIPDTALGPGLPLTGIRIGSNGALNPRLPPTLRPSVEGLVDRPVRTDVFVDGTYRQSAQVPYGPYSIELLPQFAGRGDIEVVSTDLSGVQTRVVIPYYQAPQMLAPGASEWSVDSGVLAGDVALDRQGGGHPFIASGSWRYGVGRRLTAQGQVLVSPRIARVALSADMVTPTLGATGLGLVWQTSPAQGSKVWLGAGQEYASRDFSASVRTEQILGGCPAGVRGGPLSDRLARACRRSSAVLGTSIGPRWSVSAAADQVREADGRRSTVAALNARVQLGPFSQLGLSLQNVTIDGKRAVVGLLTYSRPLGAGYAVQTGVQQRSDSGSSLQWSAQKLPAADLAPDGPRFQVYGGLGHLQNNVGARWSDEAGLFDWRSELRVDSRGLTGASGIAGAVGFAEGHAFLARRIDDAFIVVDAGLPGLPVLLDNREVARTGSDGRAIVPGARARQENLIGVDTSALPIPYSIPRDQIAIVPGLGAGALARFDPSDGGVSIPVRDAAGESLPAGAVVTVSSQRLATAVTSRSEVFLDRADRVAELTIEWAGRRCRLRYDPKVDAGAGVHRCVAP